MDASHFSWLVAPGPGREEKFFWLSALFLKYAGLASTSERGVFCRGAGSFNNALHPTYLPPLRYGKYAGEPERWAS